MTKIIVDASLEGKLTNLLDPAQLCNQAGRVLGEFRPAIDHSMYAGVDSPLSEDELDRRERDEEGRPLRQILTDLAPSS